MLWDCIVQNRQNEGEGEPHNEGEGEQQNEGEGEPHNEGEGEQQPGENEAKCVVCYTEFCNTCSPCLESRAGCPCPCNEDMCNKCFTTVVVRTARQCPDPNCDKWHVKCPNCRTICNLDQKLFNWCHNTVVHQNLI